MWMALKRIVRCPAVVVGLGIAIAGPASAQPPSVIELFTSQGCSSCPPADALLEKLATEPDVIAVSLPVDYWDYLGWKDTFAKPAFSQRQRAYAIARGDRQVYTPQAVINGAAHANGASRREIAAAMAETSARGDVGMTLAKTGGDVTVSIAADKAGSAARVGTLVALPIIGRREVSIGRGENARTKVVYTNIAQDVIALGTWSGGKLDVRVPAPAMAGAEGLVVLLQASSASAPGPIMAAAKVDLK